MSRQFKHLGMQLKACKASILSNIRLCRAKADAHEKHLQVSFSAPTQIKRDSLSLSLYHLLSKFANSLDLDLRRLAKSGAELIM